MSRSKIKSKIQKMGGIVAFSKKFEIRQATISDFLNGKINPTYNKLQTILKSVGMSIQDDLPGKLVSVKSVIVDGVSYKNGDKYKGQKIYLCIGCPQSSHQAFMFEVGESDYECLFV